MNYGLLLEIPPPRRVRRSPAVAACLRLLIGVTALMMIVVTAIESTKINERQALVERGKVTQGTVYGKRDSSKQSQRKLLFEYYVDGKRFTGGKSVSRAKFDEGRIGDPVIVTYLPEKPQIDFAGVVSRDTVTSAKNHLAMLLTIVLGLGVATWIVFRVIVQRDLDLMERGIAVEGEIIAIAPVTIKKTQYFPTSFKYILNGEATIGHFNLTSEQGSRHGKGHRMILLVDPDNPGILRPVEDLKFAECPDLDP